jgi:hypothetical protein
VVLSVGEEGLVPAFDLCDLGRFHSFDGVFQHFRYAEIIEVIFAATELVEVSEILPPVAVEAGISGQYLPVWSEEFKSEVDLGG